jgi:hypothetical protein
VTPSVVTEYLRQCGSIINANRFMLYMDKTQTCSCISRPVGLVSKSMFLTRAFPEIYNSLTKDIPTCKRRVRY